MNQTEFTDKNGKTIYAYPVVLMEDQTAVSVEGANSVTEFVDPESGRRIYATPLVIMEDRRSNLPTSGAAVKDVSLARPPRHTDNAAKGFTSSSLWQSQGQVYSLATPPTATEAVWVKAQPSGGAFADIATSTKVAAGLRAMKAGYTGVACIVTATIGGVATDFNISILADGRLDEVAMRSVLGRADAGTQVICKQLNDQSGSGNHLTKGANPAPYIEWDSLLKCFVLVFPEGTSPSVLTIPSSVIVSGNAFSLAVYGRCMNASSNNDRGLLAIGTGDTINIFASTTGTAVHRGTLGQMGGFVRPPTNGCITLLAMSSTSGVVVSNETQNTVSISNDTRTLEGGILGCFGTANGPSGSHRIVGFGMCGSTLTAAQIAALKYDAYVALDVRPQALQNNVIWVGDSRSQRREFPAAAALLDRLGPDANVINLGVSSATSDNIGTRQIASSAAALYRSGAKNVAVMFGGINDFLVANLTPAQSLAAIKANAAALKTQGWSVILLNETATTSTTNGANTRLAQLRTLITEAGAVGMGVDELVDLGGYTTIMTASNAMFYPDGIHGSSAVATLIASAVREYVAKYLGWT